jgi:hypothetical protein
MYMIFIQNKKVKTIQKHQKKFCFFRLFYPFYTEKINVESFTNIGME